MFKIIPCHMIDVLVDSKLCCVHFCRIKSERTNGSVLTFDLNNLATLNDNTFYTTIDIMNA